MSNRGKRYSLEEKKKVVDYVEEYNASHNGRGGVANACREFGITAITVKAWVQNYGSPELVSSTQSSNKRGSVYQQLANLDIQIIEKEAELSKLKEKFSKLKEKLDL